MWGRTKCKPESGSKAHFQGLYQALKLAPKKWFD
jgi:hypothetical protein